MIIDGKLLWWADVHGREGFMDGGGCLWAANVGGLGVVIDGE